MKTSFRHIIGAFRVVRRRSVEVQRPGLAIWADAGEKAAVEVQASIRAEAHRDEVCDLEAERALENALADGLDASDRPLVEAALRNVRRSREAAHRIEEVAS